jgi:hypothetical protein
MIVTDSLARLEKRGEEFLLQCARDGGSFSVDFPQWKDRAWAMEKPQVQTPDLSYSSRRSSADESLVDKENNG